VGLSPFLNMFVYPDFLAHRSLFTKKASDWQQQKMLRRWRDSRNSHRCLCGRDTKLD